MGTAICHRHAPTKGGQINTEDLQAIAAFNCSAAVFCSALLFDDLHGMLLPPCTHTHPAWTPPPPRVSSPKLASSRSPGSQPAAFPTSPLVSHAVEGSYRRRGASMHSDQRCCSIASLQCVRVQSRSNPLCNAGVEGGYNSPSQAPVASSYCRKEQ